MVILFSPVQSNEGKQMGTEIKTWQIMDGKLIPIDTTLINEGRTEPYDLEPWLASNPEIIGSNIIIIGQQVPTNSGPIDLLGIDKSGNTVIIEIKRDELPRESLAQAIDYASDVADWTVEHLSELCSDFAKATLENAFKEAFPGADLENVNLNSTQRIVLVGFSIESSLERMIEWLSDNYAMNINAVVLAYVKTKSGDELLTKTSIISEEMEQEKRRKQKKFEIYHLSDHLAFISNAEVRARFSALIDDIRSWTPGDISIDAIKYAISIKVNHHVFAYLHPRRQHFLISTYNAEDEWKDYSIKGENDLENVKPLMKKAMERRLGG